MGLGLKRAYLVRIVCLVLKGIFKENTDQAPFISGC